MALRLAGEDIGAVRGLDGQGWLREVTASDASPGVVVDQQGAGRLLEMQQNGAVASYFDNDGDLVIPDHVAVGSNPSATGHVRAPNNGRVNFRNAANSADIACIGVDGDDKVHLSPSGADVFFEGVADVRNGIKNTGASDGGAVAILEDLRVKGNLRARDAGDAEDVIVLNRDRPSLVIKETGAHEADANIAEDFGHLYVYNDGAGTTQLVVKLKVGGVVKTGTLALT